MLTRILGAIAGALLLAAAIFVLAMNAIAENGNFMATRRFNCGNVIVDGRAYDRDLDGAADYWAYKIWDAKKPFAQFWSKDGKFERAIINGVEYGPDQLAEVNEHDLCVDARKWKEGLAVGK